MGLTKSRELFESITFSLANKRQVRDLKHERIQRTVSSFEEGEHHMTRCTIQGAFRSCEWASAVSHQGNVDASQSCRCKEMNGV